MLPRKRVNAGMDHASKTTAFIGGRRALALDAVVAIASAGRCVRSIAFALLISAHSFDIANVNSRTVENVWMSGVRQAVLERSSVYILSIRLGDAEPQVFRSNSPHDFSILALNTLSTL